MFNIFDLTITYIFFNNIIFTTSLSLLKSTGTGTSLPAFNLSTIFFKLLKLVGTFFNFSIANLFTLDFYLAKLTFLANFYASKPVAFF